MTMLVLCGRLGLNSSKLHRGQRGAENFSGSEAAILGMEKTRNEKRNLLHF